MKRIILLALSCLLAAAYTPLAGQGIIDKLADTACQCISKKNPDQMSTEDLQMQLGFCIMEAVGNNQEAFQKEYGELDFANQTAMNKLGEDIGMKMAFKCPEVIMRMAATEGPAAPAAPKTSAGGSATGSLSGTIRSIDGEEVVSVTLVEPSGRTQKLLWLSYFPGSDRLAENPKAAVGAKVQVSYETLEVYSPKAKEYFERKKITGLSFE